jgi:hypothetical protein
MMHQHSRSVWNNSSATPLVSVLLVSLFCSGQAFKQPEIKLVIRGDVARPMSLILKNLDSFQKFQISKIALVNERKSPAGVLDSVSTAAIYREPPSTKGANYGRQKR